MLGFRACKAGFSERKGTPLFGSLLPPAKVISVLHYIAGFFGFGGSSRRLAKCQRGVGG